MSNVNILRAVDNIRANTTVYTPVVEMIVNAIQAIDEKGVSGSVHTRVLRDRQTSLIEGDDVLPSVVGFEISDVGIGFTEAHRESFDTLFTDLKIREGGKGFGRFTCLKYFQDLAIDSTFEDGGKLCRRTFSMGKGNEIIVDE